jgi:hypothetical protein
MGCWGVGVTPHPQPFSSPSPLELGRREHDATGTESPLSCLRRERGLGVRAVDWSPLMPIVGLVAPLPVLI